MKRRLTRRVFGRLRANAPYPGAKQNPPIPPSRRQTLGATPIGKASEEITRRSERFTAKSPRDYQGRIDKRSRRNELKDFSTLFAENHRAVPGRSNVLPRETAQFDSAINVHYGHRILPGYNVRHGFRTTYVRYEPGRYQLPLEPVKGRVFTQVATDRMFIKRN